MRSPPARGRQGPTVAVHATLVWGPGIPTPRAAQVPPRAVGQVGHHLEGAPQPGSRERRSRAGPGSRALPRSRASSGTARLCRHPLEGLGRVEDFLAGSSPKRATTPPRGWCRDFGVADRVGGAVQPGPPEPEADHAVDRATGEPKTSWVPPTAVAASSSLTRGAKTTPSSRAGWADPGELEVETPERRSLVAADEAPRCAARARVEPALIEHQAHEGLEAADDRDPARGGRVHVVEAHRRPAGIVGVPSADRRLGAFDLYGHRHPLCASAGRWAQPDGGICTK